jgi:hypothetical protein
VKRLLLLILALGITSCNEGNDTGPGQANSKVPNLTPAPTYGIKDIWEFTDGDGACAASEEFGDLSSIHNGCINYFQVTRFVDGSAYFTASFGPYGYVWTCSRFLPPNSTAFSQDCLVFRYTSFRFIGGLSGSMPTVSVNYDMSIDLNFSNTPARSLPLIRVY